MNARFALAVLMEIAAIAISGSADAPLGQPLAVLGLVIAPAARYPAPHRKPVLQMTAFLAAVVLLWLAFSYWQSFTPQTPVWRRGRDFAMTTAFAVCVLWQLRGQRREVLAELASRN